VINANKIREDIAAKAKRIIILDRPQNIIEAQRRDRWLTDNFYNFWRKENATLWASYSIEISKTLLKRDYPEKTFVIQDPVNNTLIPITDIDVKPLSQEGIIYIPLKWEGVHKWHEWLLQIAQDTEVLMQVMRKKELFSALSDEELRGQLPQIINVMIATEWIFSLHEKKKLIETNEKLQGRLVYGHPIVYDRKSYHEASDRIIQVDFSKSIAINGKDRLPEWFESGLSNDPQLQQFLDHSPFSLTMPVKNAIAKGITMFVRWKDQRTSDGEYISSTRFREELLKPIPNISLIEEMFSPSIAKIITDPENLKKIAERLLIEQELKELSVQIDEENRKIYSQQYGDTDLLYKRDTKTTQKWDQKNFFDARIVSNSDPLCTEKKEYIVSLNDNKKKTLSERKNTLREERNVRDLNFWNENTITSE
jgi:hypothetical protein